ncbi:PqqD family protein [Bacillus sp. MUM 116]|uniref:PqqD family protein n=1 Tax=Bacillus sp. MUM 116 TaxID=1678002 RepID=UPI00210BB39E|nr:PqqD family protein [Bacillus sp. MUM 116]
MMTPYIQKENVETTELDGEWILLNTDQLTITKLNEVGGLCWSLLNKEQTAESLALAVSEKFKSTEDKEQLKKDMEEFLSHLDECGLIENVN